MHKYILMLVIDHLQLHDCSDVMSSVVQLISNGTKNMKCHVNLTISTMLLPKPSNEQLKIEQLENRQHEPDIRTENTLKCVCDRIQHIGVEFNLRLLCLEEVVKMKLEVT